MSQVGSEGPDGVMGVCHRNTWRGCTVVKLALCERVCSCACGGGVGNGALEREKLDWTDGLRQDVLLHVRDKEEGRMRKVDTW